MHRLVKRAIDGLIRRFVAPYHRWIVAASLALTALSVWVIISQWNINSDLRALLPADSEAARAMDEVDARVGSDSALFVVVDSPDRQANREFAATFADKLEGLDAVSVAHFHNKKEYFRDHQLLYLPELRERVAKKIKDAKKRANPLFVPVDSDKNESESLDPDPYDEKRKQAHDRYKEYLESEDGYALTIVVKLRESSKDLAATERLLETIKDLEADVDPSSAGGDEADEPSDDDVEYFVEADDEVSCRTSVPNSAQSPHTSSSAPSTFTVFGSATVVPHISHWTIPCVCQRRV